LRGLALVVHRDEPARLGRGREKFRPKAVAVDHDNAAGEWGKVALFEW
jgi:hypothetical protein